MAHVSTTNSKDFAQGIYLKVKKVDHFIKVDINLNRGAGYEEKEDANHCNCSFVVS